MTTCSTHVLDAARGLPAAGIDVTLADADGTALEHARTDEDGRVRWAGDLAPGAYRLTFATGEWFAAADRDTFFGRVDLTVALDSEHVHVALLLSPYAYTTYRGS
ncbi:hydroxyisourate hydrolase [Nocardioides zeae]|uniref:5-hydroxyisourate hydrolase n=1 Tax=Nocardioides imazamoxiresistens TaxID=3231893 RepID=A0ABU3PQM9_9ACTN|nr:hydroxyisourate hydrolase [Nocardioides zeae]MDT9591491.1 hydroxyisourate hydrolase [Nocardioides zeae]